MIEKIVSGGQTGVDTVALDVAIALGIPHGGWCPKERLREDDIIPMQYHLQETLTSEYSERTKLNIRDSDDTLIFLPRDKMITDGTILTIEEAKAKGKPHLIIDNFEPQQVIIIRDWLEMNKIKILNVAGARESQSLGIYLECYQFLKNIFQ